MFFKYINLGINLDKVVDYKENFILDDNKLLKGIEIKFSLKKEKLTCPFCNSIKTNKFDSSLRKVRPFLVNNLIIYIQFYTIRYYCKECRKRFYPEIDFIEKRKRVLNMNKLQVIELLKLNLTFTQISKITNLTIQTVYNIFKSIKIDKPKLDTVISIDEFKYTNKKHKYGFIILNYNQNKLYDILKDRETKTIEEYFKSIDIKEREKVEFITMDLYTPYRKICKKYFKNAKIIADKFHYKRFLIKKLKKEIEKNIKLNNKNSNILKYYKKYLLVDYKNIDKLIFNKFNSRYENKIKVINNILKLNNKIKELYILILKFNKIIKLVNNKLIKNSLIKRYYNNFLIDIKNNIKIYKTFKIWNNEIINSLKFNYTNSKIEGFNNKIKTTLKNSYGFRNFYTLKNKVLFSFL